MQTPRAASRWILDLALRELSHLLLTDVDGDGIPDGLEAALDRAEALAADTRSPVDDIGVRIVRDMAAKHPEWAEYVYRQAARKVRRSRRA